MSYFLFGITVLCLTTFLFIDLVIAESECSYGNRSPPVAEPDEVKLKLNCNVEECHHNYTWDKVNGTDTTRLGENRGLLSINITSVTEYYGGITFKCSCIASTKCQKFKIGVKPIITLTLSSRVVKTGTEAFINCTAIGYPTTFVFRLVHYHPNHSSYSNLDTQSLPNGVYYRITSANRSDIGEYRCSVHSIFPEYNNQELQGNTVTKNLTVYDPPYISCTFNDTVFYEGQNQTAVLECATDGDDSWIDVVVNWTKSDGSPIREAHTVTLSERNVSYLILHQVVKDRFYSCNVYSQFGLEDSALLTVLFAGTEVCGENCTSTDSVKPLPDSGCVWRMWWTIFFLALFLIVTGVLAVIIILECLFGKSIVRLIMKECLHIGGEKCGGNKGDNCGEIPVSPTSLKNSRT